VSSAEIGRIAGFLGLSEDEFIQRHTRLNRRRTGLSLLEAGDGRCVWLNGVDCRLQPVKPDQCRGFPNTWNFPGWRQLCQAIEIPRPAGSHPDPEPGAPPGDGGVTRPAAP
jgi:Fe-S-cluster containining protein